MPTAPRRKTPKTAEADVEAQLLAIERGEGDGNIELDNGKLHVSSLGKTYFAKSGTTKGALMRYYARIWPVLHAHVEGRPLVLKRFPDGVGGQMFFQQNAGPRVPEGVRVKTFDTKDEGPKPRIIGGDLLTMLYTVQLGAIEVHPWLSRTRDIDAADRCLIDLDPGDDVPFSHVVDLARHVLKIAKQCELPIAVKTSGSSGMHLVIPLPPRTSYDTSAQLALLVARAVVAHRPERATVQRSIRARPKGTIYVDALQNARGKSMACAYSVRAREDGTVSAPLRERELTSRLRTSAFTIRTVPARVAKVGDVFGEALANRPTARTIKDAMRALEQVLEERPEAAEPQRKVKRSRAGGEGARTAGGRSRIPRA